MKKKLALLLVLGLVLIMSFGVVHADGSIEDDADVNARPESGDEIQAIIGSISGSLVRIGDRQARATVSCACDEDATVIEASMQVQRLNTETGKYYNYTEEPYYRYAYDASSLLTVDTITVQHAGTYRVKVNYTADFDGVIYPAGPAYTQAVYL